MSKVYAIIGSNSMTVVADEVRYTPATGEVLMKSERPTDGEYIANENGEWVVPEPTVEEKLEALDRQYNSDKAILMSQYTEADIDGDEELKATIKAELVALREQYDKDYKKIVNP